MVKSTIRDIPKDARIPFSDAHAMTSIDVLKNTTAIAAVTIHPMILIRVPEILNNTSPTNITVMGIIARIKS
jgi:hypothetical protein